MAVVIGVTGFSGSGKTTLIERLLPQLQAQGLRVGVIKHAHDGFDLDGRGTDSWRCWQAGAQAVLVAAPQELLLRQRAAETVQLAQALALMPHDLDCVLVEGFASAAQGSQPPVAMRVVVSQEALWLEGQRLSRDDIATVAQAIVRVVKEKWGRFSFIASRSAGDTERRS